MYQITAFKDNKHVDILFRNRNEQIDTAINIQSENYIVNVGEEQYADFLKLEFHLDFPEFDLENVFIDYYETEISTSNYTKKPFIHENKYFKKEVIVYNLPFTGNIDLLEFRPSTYNLNGNMILNCDIEQNYLKFEFLNLHNDTNQIRNDYHQTLARLFGNYEYLKIEVGSYNNNLRKVILQSIRNRKATILRKMDFLTSLGVPIKHKANVSETFSIPRPEFKKKIYIKPSVMKNGFKPDPALDNENYQLILKYINDIGRNFERMPSVYVDKDEESLRDHILFVIDPNFEYGSASGETFNKIGKTDILLRYDSSVVFVAECKFWKGIKEFFKAIDQLLGYLTWRDSKTSLVLFVQNKEFSSVLNSIKISTRDHKNFVKELGQSNESWINYIFSLPNDINREIKLAVMAYHLPI